MTTEQKLREALQRARRFIEYARYVLEVEHLPMRQFPSQRDADKYLKMIDEALRHQPQQKLRLALEEIREVWAGSEVGVPIYAQEACAIRLCKQMYQIAVGALSAEPQTSDEGTPTTPLTDAKEKETERSTQPKPPRWYTRNEIVHTLKRMKYHETIAQELADWIVRHLQGAFNKGFQKGMAARSAQLERALHAKELELAKLREDRDSWRRVCEGYEEKRLAALQSVPAAPQEGKTNKHLMEEAQNYANHLLQTDQFQPAEIVQRLIDALRAPQPATPRGDGGEAVEPDNTKVICPECCYQFRAIPVQVQHLMLNAGVEPPFTAPPAATVPGGWRLVPKIATQEMLDKACTGGWAIKNLKHYGISYEEIFGLFQETYEIMLAAAPQSGKKEE